MVLALVQRQLSGPNKLAARTVVQCCSNMHCCGTRPAGGAGICVQCVLISFLACTLRGVLMVQIGHLATWTKEVQAECETRGFLNDWSLRGQVSRRSSWTTGSSNDYWHQSGYCSDVPGLSNAHPYLQASTAATLGMLLM